jgi:hypothetical protein
MSQSTWDYLLRFTKEHEGRAFFMYNNRPLKTDKQDITCGIGFRIETAEVGATTFRPLFRVKATGLVPSEPQMRAEFHRVDGIPRTATNLFTDYADASAYAMDEAATWEFMRGLMRSKFEAQRSAAGGEFLTHFKDMPAQAQIALVSYNYGWSIERSPKLCRILNADHLDFLGAMDQVLQAKDNPELAPKNTAHQTLMWNAAQIVKLKGTPDAPDWDLLPTGYKPPDRLKAAASP